MSVNTKLALDAVAWLEAHPEHFDMSRWYWCTHPQDTTSENTEPYYGESLSSVGDIQEYGVGCGTTLCYAGAIVYTAIEQGYIVSPNNVISQQAAILICGEDYHYSDYWALMEIFLGLYWEDEEEIDLSSITLDMLQEAVEDFVSNYDE